jgi:hypothetical protein
MKKLILILLGALLIGLAATSAALADSNCDSSDPGNVPLQFE